MFFYQPRAPDAGALLIGSVTHACFSARTGIKCICYRHHRVRYYGVAAGGCEGSAGLYSFRRLVDQRLCPWRGYRRTDHGAANGEAAAQKDSAAADGDFHLRQYYVCAELQLRFPDAGAHYHRPVPRSILRHWRCSGGESGGSQPSGFCRGVDVHRSDIGQRVGGADRHCSGASIGLALNLLGGDGDRRIIPVGAV
ncbi:hypothetical protein D3C73_1220790 [compost metagenome]